MKSDSYFLSKSDSRSSILRQIRKAPISRSEIAVRAGLCKSSVTSITNQLISQGILSEIGSVDTGVGRRPVLLDIVAEYGYAIGVIIDVISSVCITDLKANLIYCKEITTNGTTESLSDEIKSAIDGALSASNIPLNKCVGIGISIDTPSKELRNAIQKQLEHNFGLYTLVGLPSMLTCVGQENTDSGSALLIEFGEILRSVLSIDGKILSCGNIEHFSIDLGGALCSCGRSGCLGRYISRTALYENGYFDGLDCEPTFSFVGEKLFAALSSITNLIELNRVIICSQKGENGEPLLLKLKELFKNQPHAPDLIWLDTSPECLRKSVCNAVLNEFFNN